MSTIKFEVRLRHEDYDKHLKGWHCSVLKIPGTKVDAIYTPQGEVPRDNYKPDYSAHSIRFEHWKDPPTDDVTVRLTVLRTLYSSSRTAWIGVFGSVLGAILGALATYALTPKPDTHVPAPNACPSTPQPSVTPSSTSTAPVTTTSTTSSSSSSTSSQSYSTASVHTPTPRPGPSVSSTPPSATTDPTIDLPQQPLPLNTKATTPHGH